MRRFNPNKASSGPWRRLINALKPENRITGAPKLSGRGRDRLTEAPKPCHHLMGATGSGEYLVALGLAIIALQDRGCPAVLPLNDSGLSRTYVRSPARKVRQSVLVE